MKKQIEKKLTEAKSKVKKCEKKLKLCDSKTFDGRHDARSMRSRIDFYEMRIGQMTRELR